MPEIPDTEDSKKLISETELIQRSKKAEELYRTGKLIRAKSMMDLLKK